MKNKNNVPRRTFFLKIIVTIVCLSSFIPFSLNATTYPLLYGESNLLMDADSGIIYIADSIDDQRGIASLTKLMSIYVVYDEMEKQGIKLEDEVTISNKVANFIYVSPMSSGVLYSAGQKETVGDLIDLVLVYSDNAATIALSEYVSGSEEEHVKKMNLKAQELGMDNTIFYNASGLTMVDYGEYILPGTNESDYNKSTARDLGILTYNLLKDYPQIIDVTAKTKITYQGTDYYTHNLLLEGMTYETKGVKGLKTGTTIEAGDCLISYYESNSKNYIAVSLDVPNINGYNRFLEAQTMFNWVDEQFLVNILDEEKIVKTVNIRGDKGANLDLYPSSNIDILKGDNIYFTLVKEEFNPQYFDEDNLLVKDIPKGKAVKTLYFSVPRLNEADEGEVPPIQSVYGNTEEVYIDLVANQDIEVAGPIQKIFLAAEYYLQDLFN